MLLAQADERVDWIGRLPLGWKRLRLKYVTNFINGAAFKPEEWGDAGIPIVRIENLNGSEEFNYTTRELPQKYIVREHDLLFGWSGNIGTSFGPFWWSRAGRFYLNQHIFRVTGFDADKRWLYWVLRAVTFEVETRVQGVIGLVHVTRPELDNTLVPVPPRGPQQRAIADFLDRKTASIDSLIAKQEQLLVLLAEKRQALITQAVTKGLDPNVPMKDSGVESIGPIPADWSSLPIRRLITGMEQGWSPIADDRLADEGEWAVLKLGSVFRGRFRPEQQKALSFGTEPEHRYEVRSGDLLITRANTLSLVGDACVVDETPARLMIPDLILDFAFA